MSYEEWIDTDGSSYKEWRNDAGKLHREDGPAEICYNANGSIRYQAFYLNGSISRKDGPAFIYHKLDSSIFHEAFYLDSQHLGDDKKGFWALWQRLDEENRRNPNLLKYLAFFS